MTQFKTYMIYLAFMVCTLLSTQVVAGSPNDMTCWEVNEAGTPVCSGHDFVIKYEWQTIICPNGQCTKDLCCNPAKLCRDVDALCPVGKGNNRADYNNCWPDSTPGEPLACDYVCCWEYRFLSVDVQQSEKILQNTLRLTLASSPSSTPIPSSSMSATPSSSPSLSPSPTVSSSASATPSVTPTVTPSVTPTESPSRTPTTTPSISPSGTASASGTPSTTPTVSPTRTPSATPTATPSTSHYPKPSQLAQQIPGTPSHFPAPSAVLPRQKVPTMLTPTPTATATPSRTPSASPSGTPSITPSKSPSSTPSVTPTSTPSTSHYPNPSQLAQRIPVTPSHFPAPSAVLPSQQVPTMLTPTPTATATPSRTPSVSPSRTPSVIPTSTPSTSHYPNPSKLPQQNPGTPSHYPAPSTVLPHQHVPVMLTSTPTPTVAPSVTPSRTPSSTPTGSQTRLPTSTPSPSASHYPNPSQQPQQAPVSPSHYPAPIVQLPTQQVPVMLTPTPTATMTSSAIPSSSAPARNYPSPSKPQKQIPATPSQYPAPSVVFTSQHIPTMKSLSPTANLLPTPTSSVHVSNTVTSTGSVGPAPKPFLQPQQTSSTFGSKATPYTVNLPQQSYTVPTPTPSPAPKFSSTTLPSPQPVVDTHLRGFCGNIHVAKCASYKKDLKCCMHTDKCEGWGNCKCNSTTCCKTTRKAHDEDREIKDSDDKNNGRCHKDGHNEKCVSYNKQRCCKAGTGKCGSWATIKCSSSHCCDKRSKASNNRCRRNTRIGSTRGCSGSD